MLWLCEHIARGAFLDDPAFRANRVTGAENPGLKAEVEGGASSLANLAAAQRDMRSWDIALAAHKDFDTALRRWRGDVRRSLSPIWSTKSSVWPRNMTASSRST